MSDSGSEGDQTGSLPLNEATAAIMQNPRTLAALQAGLNRIIGQQSGYIQSLPKPVKRRIKALKNLQVECAKVEGIFYERVHALECEFAEKFKPLFDKRRSIVNGLVEPTDEECQWPSDEEEEADEKEEKGEGDVSQLSGDVKEKVTIEDEEKVETTDLPDDVKGIPEFWLTAMKNVDTLAEMIQEHDEPILKHLLDIRVIFTGPDSNVDTTQYPQPTPMNTTPEYEKTQTMKFSPKWQVGCPWLQNGEKGMTCQWCTENRKVFKTQILHTFSKFIDGCTSHKAESVSYHKKSAAHVLETQCHKAKLQPEKMPKGFVLEYHFSPNPFFSNNVLTKSYKMKCEPDDDDPFAFEGPEIISTSGCHIDWKKGKNVTQKVVKKRKGSPGKGQTRFVRKTVKNDSFFNFFAPPEVPEDEADMDEETEALLAADFEIGHFFRERIVPKGVLYFTGEALEDEFEEEEEEEGDEAEGGDGEEDDDDDPDYQPPQDGEKPQECKNQ